MQTLRFCAGSLLAMLASLPWGIHAQSSLPSAEELERLGARVGKIRIERENIFDQTDPKENYFPYRVANKLHILTREEVLRRELLLWEGDLFSQRLLEESERNLRGLNVIYHVRIRPVAYHDGLVDLLISTQDTWTTRPSARVSRSGGETVTGFSFSDLNFMGRVKLLRFSRLNEVDRSTNEISYTDPRIWGSRFALETFYQGSSDGLSRGLDISRPWYALDSRWAMNTSGVHLARGSRLFCDSDSRDCDPNENEISEFDQVTKSIDLEYGLSPGLYEDRVIRYGVGYSYLRELFSQNASDPGFGTVVLPGDQKFVGPTFSFQRLKANYIQVTFYNHFDRVEDFNLGNDFKLFTQLSLADLGADHSELILQAADSFGVPLNQYANLFYSVSLSGRTGAGEARNVVFSQALESYWRISAQQTLYARAAFDVGIHLDPQNQFLLGGDTGLRGYPIRQFAGDRRLLLSLEHRVFTSWEILRLVRIGFAAFVEAGDAWYSLNGERLSDLHSNLGVGLRFGVTRSSIFSVSRLDLAHAVDAEENEVPQFQILFGTSLRF